MEANKSPKNFEPEKKDSSTTNVQTKKEVKTFTPKKEDNTKKKGKQRQRFAQKRSEVPSVQFQNKNTRPSQLAATVSSERVSPLIPCTSRDELPVILDDFITHLNQIQTSRAFVQFTLTDNLSFSIADAFLRFIKFRMTALNRTEDQINNVTRMLQAACNLCIAAQLYSSLSQAEKMKLDEFKFLKDFKTPMPAMMVEIITRLGNFSTTAGRFEIDNVGQTILSLIGSTFQLANSSSAPTENTGKILIKHTLCLNSIESCFNSIYESILPRHYSVEFIDDDHVITFYKEYEQWISSGKVGPEPQPRSSFYTYIMPTFKTFQGMTDISEIVNNHARGQDLQDIHDIVNKTTLADIFTTQNAAVFKNFGYEMLFEDVDELRNGIIIVLDEIRENLSSFGQFYKMVDFFPTNHGEMCQLVKQNADLNIAEFPFVMNIQDIHIGFMYDMCQSWRLVCAIDTECKKSVLIERGEYIHQFMKPP